MSEKSFDVAAGALCLDFANTVNWHASEQPVEGLQDYFDLIQWGTAAGALTGAQAAALRRAAEGQPEAAAAALARAVQLREAIYRIFVAYAESGKVGEGDLAILNETLGEALGRLRVMPASASPFLLDYPPHLAHLDRVRWAAARSAAELLTGENLERVRQCADDRGCGYLFLDVSRNRSRRWCSMESCGNRAKARRHYRRQQQGDEMA
ncbi:MAG: hypothetical protein Fur0021_37460 [Candidatus Promineifilaceae bacterium]